MPFETIELSVTVDCELEDMQKRHDRGAAALARLADAVGKPEKMQLNSRQDVMSRILEREWFAVSVERLEMIADLIDRQKELIHVKEKELQAVYHSGTF